MLPAKDFDVKNLVQLGTIIVGIGMTFATLKERVDTLQIEISGNKREIQQMQNVVYTLKEQLSILNYRVDETRRK